MSDPLEQQPDEESRHGQTQPIRLPRQRSITRTHWQLVVLLLIFLVLAVVYSVSLPLGEGADETDHFALVRFIAEQGRPPMTVEERQSIGPKGDASPIYHGLVAVITQHVDTSQLAQLPDTQARPERYIPTDGFRSNRIFHTEDEAFPFRGIVLAWHLGRLLSVLFGAVTVVAAYVTALAIYPDRPYFALAAAGFVAFLPRFVINSAVVSDDNLVVPLIAFAVYCMVRVAQGDRRTRTLIILGALMGGAAVVKYHSLLLLPEMTALLMVLAWREKWGWRALLRRWGWCMGAFLVVAGWWFVVLVVQFNQVADLGLVRGLMAPLGDPVVTAGLGRTLGFQPGGMLSPEFDWADWGSLFFRSFWVTYAWLHVFAPPVVYHILGFFLLLAGLGLAKLLWEYISSLLKRRQAAEDDEEGAQPGPVWRWDIALLAAHLLLFLGIIVLRYLLKPARETGQGRHLYPALTSVAFFFVLGLHTVGDTVVAWVKPRVAPKSRAWYSRQAAIDRVLALGISGGLLALSVLALPLFILPEYQPRLPLMTADPSDSPISQPLSVSFADGLDLVGYDQSTATAEAGGELPVTLYWHAGERQDQDFLIRLCLTDDSGQPVVCRDGYPVDGRYPMRAWEKGYLIRDQVNLPVPYCLAPGEYQLTLSALPLRTDTAFTSLEDVEGSQDDPVFLGPVSVTAPVGDQPSGEVGGYDLRIGDAKQESGKAELSQIRQTLVVMDYRAGETGPPDAGDSPRFQRVGPVDDAAGGWLPVDAGVSYLCPDGGSVRTVSFIVDPGLRPGGYQLVTDDQVQSGLSLDLLTHIRDFSPPDNIPNPVDLVFNDQVELLGYEFDPSDRWPGDRIEVTAYWRSQQVMGHHYVVTLYLVDKVTGEVGGQAEWTLGGHYPNVLWAPGEWVEGLYPLMVGLQTPPGLYDVELSLYEYEEGIFRFLPMTSAGQPGAEGGEEATQVNLGRVRIKDPAGTRPPAQPVDIRVGDEIRLLGYDISSDRLAAGGTLDLALHWQADSPPAADYTVFTQLVGPDGLVWAQKDNQPQAGRYPTSAWDLQMPVVDRYQLTLAEGAPGGPYRLLVGMYLLETGQRLAVTGEDGNRLPDDAIPLTTINVE